MKNYVITVYVEDAVVNTDLLKSVPLSQARTLLEFAITKYFERGDYSEWDEDDNMRLNAYDGYGFKTDLHGKVREVEK